MKVDSKLILKPDAELKVQKIDYSDPEIIAIIKDRVAKSTLLSIRVDQHGMRIKKFRC